MPKWTNDPIVVLDDDGPMIGVVLARGLMAIAIFAGTLTASNEPATYRRIGKEWRRVRVRPFHTLGERFWISNGYYEWSRLEWIALWLRAARGERERIPNMRTVQR